MEKLTILGATGSIGLSALKVIENHPDKYSVFALTGNKRVEQMLDLCRQHKPKIVVMVDVPSAKKLSAQIHLEGLDSDISVLSGKENLDIVAGHARTDTVMAAIVGSAGLNPTLASVKAGKKVLLANKESLVMAGSIFMEAVKQSGATLLPIDSEHNAIFQCLPMDVQTGKASVDHHSGIEKIILTASGGPFRSRQNIDLSQVSPDDACAHPNWSMGRKISVDSATMMNKGLELIEACHLFSVPSDKIEIVIHPQSVIHSLVQYTDGSVLAQLGNPDMRTPIAHALAWPDRITTTVQSLDLIKIGRLDFETPDLNRFPCLSLAMDAAKQGGCYPTILNAANEVAVDAFLNNRILFTDIQLVVAKTIEQYSQTFPDSIEQVQILDTEARKKSESLVEIFANQKELKYQGIRQAT